MNCKPNAGEGHMSVCRKCKKAVMCKGGNTTNLFAHLRSALPLCTKRHQKRQGVSREREVTLLTYTCCCDPKGMQYNLKSAQAQELNCAVGYNVAKDMQPYFIIEQEGFKRLVQKLNPQYSLPSCKCT